MATEAQILANRRNAQQSTGPRTERGKAVVSMNALRHGLLAAEPLLQGEDPDEFEAFVIETISDLKPVGRPQLSVAERIAHIQWKLRRIPHLESAMFDECVGRRRYNDDVDQSHALAVSCRSLVRDFSVVGGGITAKLQLYEQRLERSLRSCMKELRELRKEAAEREEEDEWTLIPDDDDDDDDCEEEEDSDADSSEEESESETEESTAQSEMNKQTQFSCNANEVNEIDSTPTDVPCRNLTPLPPGEAA